VRSPPDGPTPTVAAVLLPAERARVEAAGSGSFTVLHRDSIPEAINLVRERPVDAVLVSVHRCDPAEVDAVRRLVTSFPGLPAVALLSRHDPSNAGALLRLGASGVRDVIDVTAPMGWARLRQLVSEPATRPAARILAPLMDRLAESPPDARIFMEALVRLAPTTPTVRGVAKVFSVQPSTLMSRFLRAGLPSAKRYLAAVRLLYAAQYMESDGLSITDVAYRLDCSSPQSFGRHLRTLLGITSTEFRRRFPFPAAMERFLVVMVDPYLDRWRTFHPLIKPAGHGGAIADLASKAGVPVRRGRTSGQTEIGGSS
jgi:AraC-like DNA-binding protein